ncbi:MAG TPA: hypothetical protein VFK34_01485 [Marmoricola sp.]|jgi:hypothetical protein|nr:hypothetical protein [Marmoricola sp.]
MNRTAAAAIIATAIVGTIGGTVSAVVRGDEPPPPPTTSAPSGTVLYAGAHLIHDGKEQVRYDAPFDTPSRLVRADEGYLIAQDTGQDGRTSRVFHVTTEGTTTRLADLAGAWDLNPDGDQVVGVGADTGKVETRDLDGTITATWDGPQGAQNPVWTADGTVLVSTDDGAGGWHLHEWHPKGGSSRLLDRVGYAELAASTDGTLISGSVGIEGFSVKDENYCLGVAAAETGPGETLSWSTCDWRLNAPGTPAFSPGSGRILAVPSESDGFGPGRLATFSARQGPDTDLRAFNTPPMTMAAVWLDDQHLVLKGATDFDLDEDTGSWLKVCDLDGKCTDTARRAHGDLVLGEQG